MSVTSPGNQDPVRYPELSTRLRDRSLMGMLKLFGPGAIIASVTIGSGETVFASRGGAVFGYSLFWCFLVGSALKGLQVYTGARFITLTGRHPLRSWMELPGPRGWFVLFVSVMTIVWMPFWVGGGLPKMLGEFTNWGGRFPGPRKQVRLRLLRSALGDFLHPGGVGFNPGFRATVSWSGFRRSWWVCCCCAWSWRPPFPAPISWPFWGAP